MIRYLLLVITMALASCSECYAGYSILVDQLIPEYTTVNGPYGAELWKSSDEAPRPPEGYGVEVCRPDNYSVFAIDTFRRSRVFTDSLGTATSTQLFAVCPQIRDTKAAEIRREGSRRLAAMAGPYSKEERETWATQHDQALEWQLNATCDCPMIRNMATSRGITIDTMVAKIMENVTLFEAGSGQILGQQQKLLDRIDAEQDFDTLLKIIWSP